MKTRTLAAGLAALTMVALAACGDDNTSSSATNAPAGTQAPAATAAPAAPETHSCTAPADTTPAPIVGGTGEGGELRLWLNGGDTPDDFVKFAIGEFNKIHPDVKVTFERQQWTGIVEKLTTALSSSDSPDVVELGNTQAQAFEAAGALKDLTATEGRARWRRPAAELGRGRHLRRQVLRRSVLRRCPRHAVPQGPVREVRHRDPDHDRRDARRGEKLKADNAVGPELLRYVPAR